jgi:hypothetical protein
LEWAKFIAAAFNLEVVTRDFLVQHFRRLKQQAVGRVVATTAVLLSLVTLEDPVVEVRHKQERRPRQELETWAVIPPSKDLLVETRERTTPLKTDKAAAVEEVRQALVLQQLARLPEQNATLCLGVSAKVWTAHPEATAHFLASVRAAGGKTALTNFGDAATVKNLLHDCHFDFLKLDATLLQNLEQDRSNGITVKYINDIIHLAGVKSIVEVGPVGLPASVLKTMSIDFVQPRL